ncbi:hypothetical protein [Streptomyces sp. NPDC096012]|uniref:hypothetical protein n=1 Tax=Streptomyces sp. NPDC096012 TaxID=3155684 RepID=UPI00336A0008
MREFVEPKVREGVDWFVDTLFWHGLGDATGTGSGLSDRPCPWDADLLLWCPPDQVPLLAGWWRQVQIHLEILREPFIQHAAEPGGRIGTFESFADLLTDWGEVVTEAERRGWGRPVLLTAVHHLPRCVRNPHGEKMFNEHLRVQRTGFE